MLKSRWFKSFVGFVIAVLAVLSIGTMAFTQQSPSVAEGNRLAPLDWYLNHDHAIIDGDNNVVPVSSNVVPSEGIPGNSFAPLDWYFSHDHAVIDGDNNVVSGANIPANTSPLDWYLTQDHAIIDGDNNIVQARAENASAEQDLRMVMQELERERLDQLNMNLSSTLVATAFVDPRNADR